MADVLLFHHAHGLTDGVRAFADRLRADGHVVVVPDLYAGRVFSTVEEGVAHAERIGFDTILDLGETIASEQTSTKLIYAGFSLGALVAHKLAQTRADAGGALLYSHGDVPIATFGDSWPAGVDLQLHIAERDPWCELEVVREFADLAGNSAHAELFLYPGSTHLFMDSGLGDYEPESAALALERTLQFLRSHD